MTNMHGASLNIMVNFDILYKVGLGTQVPGSSLVLMSLEPRPWKAEP